MPTLILYLTILAILHWLCRSFTAKQVTTLLHEKPYSVKNFSFKFTSVTAVDENNSNTKSLTTVSHLWLKAQMRQHKNSILKESHQRTNKSFWGIATTVWQLKSGNPVHFCLHQKSVTMTAAKHCLNRRTKCTPLRLRMGMGNNKLKTI